MESSTFAYVAFKKACGHMVAAAVDKPEYAKENAKEVSNWIRSGLRIERVTVERVRTELHGCDCDEQKSLLLCMEKTP